MRVAIPHKLDKAEVHRRLSENTGQIANFIPGGFADVESDWIDDEHMAMGITAMGTFVGAEITIEERQMVVDVDVPAKLSFIRGTIERGIRDNATKLLK